MSILDNRGFDPAELDRYITGDYGEDLFSRELEEDEEEYDPSCDDTPPRRGTIVPQDQDTSVD